MVWACVEEGGWACFERSVGVCSEGQGEVRTTKEDVEYASGEGEQELERLLLEWGKSGHPHLRG